MPTPTRPATYINWVTAVNPTPYITQPTTGQATTGWTGGEVPPMQYMNWLHYMTDQWVQYLDYAISNVTGIVVASKNPATDSPYNVVTADKGKLFLVDTSNGAMTFNLPVPAANFAIGIKDSAGGIDTNNITLHRNGSESIEGLAADYVMQAPWGEWWFYSDGTNWFIGTR
jgi:hypothetical protein